MAGKLFQGSRDLAYWQRTVREVYRRFVFTVEVYLYDQGVKDDLYGENMDVSFNRATSEPSYSIEGYLAELPEWKAKLLKFGLDEERPLKVHFFAESFQELAATLGRAIRPPDVGDRIFIQGEFYKVMKTNPTDYFLNTRTALTYSVDVSRVRLESISDGTTRESTEDEIYPKSQLSLQNE